MWSLVSVSCVWSRSKNMRGRSPKHTWRQEPFSSNLKSKPSSWVRLRCHVYKANKPLRNSFGFDCFGCSFVLADLPKRIVPRRKMNHNPIQLAWTIQVRKHPLFLCGSVQLLSLEQRCYQIYTESSKYPLTFLSLIPDGFFNLRLIKLRFGTLTQYLGHWWGLYSVTFTLTCYQTHYRPQTAQVTCTHKYT